MTWVLLHVPDGEDGVNKMIFDSLKNEPPNLGDFDCKTAGEWSDEQVQYAAQHITNTMDVSVKREAIEILKEFLPQPIKDAL